MAFCGQTSDMALYSGHRVGDVGSIRECRDLPIAAQFCVALGSGISQSPPVIGFCLPQHNCSAKAAILSRLVDTSSGDPSHIAQNFATSVNGSAINIFCQGPDGIENPYPAVGISMLVALLIVTAVVLFATTYDIYKKVTAKADLQLILTGRGSSSSNNNEAAQSLNNMYPAAGDGGRGGYEPPPMATTASDTNIGSDSNDDNATTRASSSSIVAVNGGGPASPLVVGEGERSRHGGGAGYGTAATPTVTTIVYEDSQVVQVPSTLVDRGDGREGWNRGESSPTTRRGVPMLPSCEHEDDTTAGVTTTRRQEGEGYGSEYDGADFHHRGVSGGNQLKGARSNNAGGSGYKRRRDRGGGGFSPRGVKDAYHEFVDEQLRQQQYNSQQSAVDPGYRRTILRKQIELRVEQIIDEMPNFQSLFNRFVLCFSMLAGLKRWRHFPASSGHSYLFHSVRTVAWMWIIVVDTYTYSAQIPTFSNNTDGPNGPERTALFAFMQRKVCDAVAIGTLVLISGYIVIHQLEVEEEAYMRDPTAYVQTLHQSFCKRWWEATKWFILRGVKRWLRIVPLYAAVVFLTQSALLQTQGGPFWPIFLQSDTLHLNCMQYSAANFAFINNIVPVDVSKRCFPWTYYFAIEFQFFLLAPVVHYLHKALPLRVYVPAFVFLAVGSLALRFISQDSCETLDAGPQPDVLVPYGHDVEKPWSLFLPFAFGALLYYAHRSVLRKAEEIKMFGSETLNVLRHSSLHSTSVRDRCTYQILLCLNYKRFRVVCIWSGCILATGTVMLSWFLVGQERDCELQPRWFVTMATLPWCFAMVLLFLPMMFGYGGLLQKFLTHRLWVGSSKLVFGAYLVGPLVVAISNAIQETPRSINGVAFFYNAWGNITFSMVIALLFHLVIEQPTMFLTRDVT